MRFSTFLNSDKTPICMFEVGTIIVALKLKKSDDWSDVSISIYSIRNFSNVRHWSASWRMAFRGRCFYLCTMSWPHSTASRP